MLLNPALSVSRTLGVPARPKGYKEKGAGENEILYVRPLWDERTQGGFWIGESPAGALP